MLPLEHLVAGIMLISLTIYVLSGGADYGGGVWDLLSFGPRAQAQRNTIAKAIAPIWEADHVWLILVIVILFTAFPQAFAAITTGLHIPIMLMLIGVVLRGSAFTFRHYGTPDDEKKHHWGLIFAVSSLITPIFIGIVVGAISAGNIFVGGRDFMQTYVWPWLGPFPIAVGVFALSLFSFLAAVYLAQESDDRELQNDFRKRALASGAFVGVMALVVFLLSAEGAPSIRHALTARPWTWPLHIATAFTAVGAFIFLWQKRFRLAVICAAAQVTLIVWGWAFAQYPYLVAPTLTIFNAAAPAITLKLLLAALIAGALFLFPAFYYLFWVFKGNRQS
jgi:cytochrome d ubiquinol oxidase subunit II